jgi:hypothetical protein
MNGQHLFSGLNYNNMTAMMGLGGAAYAATQQAALQGRNPYNPTSGYPSQVHPNMFAASPYQVTKLGMILKCRGQKIIVYNNCYLMLFF